LLGECKKQNFVDTRTQRQGKIAELMASGQTGLMEPLAPVTSDDGKTEEPGLVDKLKANIARKWTLLTDKEASDGENLVFFPSIIVIVLLVNMILGIILTAFIADADGYGALVDIGDTFKQTGEDLETLEYAVGEIAAVAQSLVESADVILDAQTQIEGLVANCTSNCTQLEDLQTTLDELTAVIVAVETLADIAANLSDSSSTNSTNSTSDGIDVDFFFTLGDVFTELADGYIPALVVTVILTFGSTIAAQLAQAANFKEKILLLRANKIQEDTLSPWSPELFHPRRASAMLGAAISNFVFSYLIWYICLFLTFLLCFWERFWTGFIANPAVYQWIIGFTVPMLINMGLAKFYEKLTVDGNGDIKPTSYSLYFLTTSILGIITGGSIAFMRMMYLWGISFVALLRIDMTMFPPIMTMLDSSWLSYQALVRFHHIYNSPPGNSQEMAERDSDAKTNTEAQESDIQPGGSTDAKTNESPATD
jgi:hypothetical protein